MASSFLFGGETYSFARRIFADLDVLPGYQSKNRLILFVNR